MRRIEGFTSTVRSKINQMLPRYAEKLASISETEGVDCVAIRAVAILFLKEKIN